MVSENGRGAIYPMLQDIQGIDFQLNALNCVIHGLQVLILGLLTFPKT